MEKKNEQKHRIASNNRREFIQKMTLLGLASGMPISFFSCEKSSEKIDYQGTGPAPYKVWEEMLMAVKTSPDFLEGRMQELIKNKNQKAMLEFVRDEIQLIPPDSKSLRRMGELMIYGIPGVLRSGFATPREKAELLNLMLNEAGFQSEVVYENTNFQTDEIQSFFFKPIDRRFEPLINQTILNRWKEELQVTPNEEIKAEIDQDESKSKELANHLFGFLPEDAFSKVHKFNYNWDNKRTPCVKLKTEGETLHFHLFDPSVPLGVLKEGVNGTTTVAKPAAYADKKLKLNLSITRGNIDEVEIVKGEWHIQELIGNQILVHFDTGLNLFQQLRTAIGNVQTFTTSLALQSFSLSPEEMGKKSFSGKTVTLQGDIIETSNDILKVNDLPISVSPNTDFQKQVHQLGVQAIPGKYPFFKLLLKPTDKNGEQIEQLSGLDFNIKINDQPVSALMHNNVKTPKVILMYDVSGSMPGDYSGEKINQFVSQLEIQILEHYPAANVQKWKTPSQLFTWLYKASSTQCDLIIFATDGDNNDKPKEEWLSTYQTGAPAIILNVRNSERSHVLTTFQTMAKATNGIVLKAEDQEETKQNILQYLKQLEIAPYIFNCNAIDKNVENKVTVSVDSGRVKAVTNFKFILFPKENTSLGAEVSGVYLDISYDKFTTRKTLAGYDPILHKSRNPNQTDFIDVRSFLLGGAIIGIEGQGATLGNQMADVLQYKLSTRLWGEALMENNIKEAREYYENGVYFFDDRQASLLQPLKNQVTESSFTFASGPRIAILKNKIGVGITHSTIGFDYVQTSNFITLATNNEEAFKITMQKTAQMALLERRLFEESAFSLLENKSLIDVEKAKQANWFDEPFKHPVNQYFWRERIYKGNNVFKVFDESSQSKAYWQINKTTGEIYGMLQNDTAGGVERIRRQLDEILMVMDTYLLLLGGMSAKSGIPLAIVGGYGKTLVKLYALASEAIVVMDTTGMDEQIKIALAELACETYKSIVYGLYGKAGAAMAGMEYLIAMITGKSFCSEP